VIDPLHDIEVGEWKKLFAHLVRMLHSMKSGSVEELDERYALTTMFKSVC
jgi:hypothetical protein